MGNQQQLIKAKILDKYKVNVEKCKVDNCNYSMITTLALEGKYSVLIDKKEQGKRLISLAILMDFYNYIEGENVMRIRKQPLGDRNIVGAKIEAKRKELGIKQIDLLTQLQINGIDLNASGLSKLEGQLRFVTDFELKAISEVLGMTLNELLGVEE